MSDAKRATSIDLMPAQQQTVWGKPAVANFAAGGAGAGFYIVAALSAGFSSTSALTLASWLAPALVLVGFSAVALEAGRPFRGPRVLARLRTSWMSRELWFGGAFIVLAAATLVIPTFPGRLLAAIAATLFVIAQGFMLRRARGIAAWDVPVMPAMFAVSAIVSGVGLWLLVDITSGRGVSNAVLASTMVLLVFGFVSWLSYVTWSNDELFLSSTASLREGLTAVCLAGGGYVVPFFLLGLAVALPDWSTLLAAVSAVAMVAGQIHAKTVLILKAGYLRPVSLHSIRLTRRVSA